MANYSQQVIYNSSHNLDALCSTGVHYQKTLSVKIIKRDQYLQIQVYDCNDYLFNYTANVDRATFDQMKLEQSLDINYDELPMQLLDLLQHTANKDMLIRLEYGEHFCKLIFYEKIRIKSLIFLTVDLQLTNQREIINEMSVHIKQLKDSNKNLMFQINTSNNETVERDKLLKVALAANKNLDAKFTNELNILEKSFSAMATKFENNITDKLLILSQKYFILVRNIEAVKIEHKIKTDSNARLTNFTKNLRLENDKNHKTIDELNMQLSALKDVRNSSEKCNQDNKVIIERIQRENFEINNKISELHKDLKEATFIIAQKTKTHEEMAKDLVQANSMLVNFTNHYDNLSKELNTIKNTLSHKERDLEEKTQNYNELLSTFEKYKNEFSYDDLEKMKKKVFETNKFCEELEKKNRETNKLNALLSRRLASGDCVDNVTSPNSNVNVNTKNHSPWMPRSNFQ